jgi:tetratricopeptide (TPR) repeat protein
MKKKSSVNKLSFTYQDSYFWYAFIPCLFLFSITCAIYFPSLHYPFQFDDTPNIVKFYDIRHKTFWDLFLCCSRWISYWLNTLYFSISRFDPWYYRLGNIVFHGITGIGVYHLVIRFFTYSKQSFVVQYASILAYVSTGLFLLHPVQTQTVSYVIQGQLEGLAALSMVYALLLFFLLLEERQDWIKGLKYFGLLGICFVGSGTKEIVIVLPLLFLLVDWFFASRGSWRGLVSRWWVHGPVWCIIGGMYLYFLKPDFFIKAFGLSITFCNNMGNVITPEPRTIITPLHFCMSQFKVILHYCWIFVWPFSISVDYDWLLVSHWWSYDCIVPFLILCACAYYTMHRVQKNRIDFISFLILWFFILILPRSSFIPSTELLMDYKTYTASIAICVGLAMALVYGMVYIRTIFKDRISLPAKKYDLSPAFTHGGLLAEYGWVHPSYAAATVFLLFLGLLTMERNTVWRSSEEFWFNIIQNAPKKARAYNNYGVSLTEKGQFADSILYYKKAIMLDPDYVDPRNNLAIALGAEGETDAAIEAMRETIRLQPWYPEGYNNLASFLIMHKRYDEAQKQLSTALQLRPHYGKALFNMGRLFWEKQQYDKAYRSFKQCCLEADFDNEDGFSAYAQSAMKLGKYDEAASLFERLLQMQPNSLNYRFHRANCYYFAQDYEHALKLFKALLEEYPDDARLHFNLGDTYIKLNLIQQALLSYKEAMKRNTFMGGVGLRIAYCLEKLGKGHEAGIFLHEYVRKGAPFDQQIAAADMLKQLKLTDQYPQDGH